MCTANNSMLCSRAVLRLEHITCSTRLVAELGSSASLLGASACCQQGVQHGLPTGAWCSQHIRQLMNCPIGPSGWLLIPLVKLSDFKSITHCLALLCLQVLVLLLTLLLRSSGMPSVSNVSVFRISKAMIVGCGQDGHEHLGDRVSLHSAATA